MSKTVYEYAFKFWLTEDSEWGESVYYTLTENQQYVVETLIRDEDNKIEDISMEMNERTWDQFIRNGGSKDLLI